MRGDRRGAEGTATAVVVSAKAPARAPAKRVKTTGKPAAKKAPAKRAAPAKVPNKSGNRGGAKRTAAAREAAAQAKAAGAIGPWGSTAARGLRDLGIVAGMAAGARVQEVAAEFGVSVKTVREVCARREARPSPLDAKPMEILDGFVRATEDTLERLRGASLAAAASGNLPVLVGAAKAEVTARRELMELLTAAGVMPQNVYLFMQEEVLRGVAKRMAQTMAAVGRGEIDAAAALEVFDAIIERREERPQLHAA